MKTKVVLPRLWGRRSARNWRQRNAFWSTQRRRIPTLPLQRSADAAAASYLEAEVARTIARRMPQSARS